MELNSPAQWPYTRLHSSSPPPLSEPYATSDRITHRTYFPSLGRIIVMADADAAGSPGTGRWATASRICKMARLSCDRVSIQPVTVNAEPIPRRLSSHFVAGRMP